MPARGVRRLNEVVSSATCLVLTVGSGIRGQHAQAAQGLLQILERRRPEHFLLVPGAARESRSVAQLVLDRLGRELRAAFVPWSDEQAFRCIERHDSVESARAALREVLRVVRARFPGAQLVIHPGSGSRQTCAGAVLAAFDEGAGWIEFGAGRAAGRGDQGAAAEQPFDAAAWLADRELALAARFWDQQWFAAAAAILRGAGVRLPAAGPRARRLEALALLADALAAKEVFSFAAAERCLRDARRQLQVSETECFAPLQTLDRWCRDTADRCARCAKVQGGDRTPAAHREILTEMVDVALRAARVERYDEAAVKLHRAMELELQLRFAEATGGNYWHGRLIKGGKVPDALRAATFLSQLQRTELPRDFSLEQIVHALHALGDASVAELWQDLTDHRKHSEWREATASRHSSLLAHGATPVDKADFKNLRRIAGRFLQLNLGETHPLPVFDHRWLEIPF